MVSVIKTEPAEWARTAKAKKAARTGEMANTAGARRRGRLFPSATHKATSPMLTPSTTHTTSTTKTRFGESCKALAPAHRRATVAVKSMRPRIENLNPSVCASAAWPGSPSRMSATPSPNHEEGRRAEDDGDRARTECLANDVVRQDRLQVDRPDDQPGQPHPNRQPGGCSPKGEQERLAKRSGNDRHDENVVQSIRGKCAGQTERIAELNMGQQAGNNPKNEVPHREAQEPLMVRHDADRCEVAENRRL